MSDAKKEATVRAYNAGAAVLAKKFSDIGPRIADIDRAFTYCNKSNPSVVEIGCGNGREAAEIIKRTTNYLGIDISKAMIALARQQAPTARFKVADVETYPLPGHTDIIFAFASLLHLDEGSVKKVLKKAHGALNPGGIFFISLKYGAYAKHQMHEPFGSRTYYSYTPKLLRTLAAGRYTVLEQDVHVLRGQKWFRIIFKNV